MKKRLWKTFPYLVLSSVVVLALAFVSLAFSVKVFFIEMSIAALGIVAAVFIYLRFGKCIKTTVKSMVSATKGMNKSYLERFGFPVAVVDSENGIVWYNSAFDRKIAIDRELIGASTGEIIKGRSIEELCGSKGADIEIGERKYTVYANPIDDGYVLYFFDDTYLKNTEREYKDSRLSVVLVAIDNSEAFADEDEDENVKAVLRVEILLQRMAGEYNALYRKMGHSRYMLIVEERELKKLIDGKFDILNKVREIKAGDIGATISIGVGRGELSLRKSMSSAKRALDMSLGRGGDQAAVLCDGEFEFFGGKSAGVERNSKVRVRVIAKSLMTAIDECDKVIIMGHKFSDLDCIGAAIGLYGAITTSFKKKVYIAVNYDQSMAKELIDSYRSQYGDEIFFEPQSLLSEISEKTLLIIVDTQSVSRLESSEIYNAVNSVIVIDHHRMSVDHLENTLVFYHEPSASSAAEMCVELIDSFPDVNLRRAEAEALLSGIILDTKNFVINSGARTFEAAAYLKKRGADTVSVRQLFSDSIDIYANKYKLVSTARIYKKCAIVIAEDEHAEMRLIASKAADELLGLRGVNASFVIFRTDADTVNISARSYGKRNVQLIMERLGGGGHHSMAAAQLRNTTFESAARQLIAAIDSQSV